MPKRKFQRAWRTDVSLLAMEKLVAWRPCLWTTSASTKKKPHPIPSTETFRLSSCQYPSYFCLQKASLINSHALPTNENSFGVFWGVFLWLPSRNVIGPDNRNRKWYNGYQHKILSFVLSIYILLRKTCPRKWGWHSKDDPFQKAPNSKPHMLSADQGLAFCGRHCDNRLSRTWKWLWVSFKKIYTSDFHVAISRDRRWLWTPSTIR